MINIWQWRITKLVGHVKLSLSSKSFFSNISQCPGNTIMCMSFFSANFYFESLPNLPNVLPLLLINLCISIRHNPHMDCIKSIANIFGHSHNILYVIVRGCNLCKNNYKRRLIIYKTYLLYAWKCIKLLTNLVINDLLSSR